MVTSGPTREWLDPVRFLSNASSGKSGWHIARRGADLFKETIYICGPGASEYLPPLAMPIGQCAIIGVAIPPSC